MTWIYYIGIPILFITFIILWWIAIQKEFEYSVQSIHLVYKWVCIKHLKEENFNIETNYYQLFLKDDESYFPRFWLNIRQIWKDPKEYEAVAAYVEENKEVWEAYSNWLKENGL